MVRRRFAFVLTGGDSLAVLPNASSTEIKLGEGFLVEDLNGREAVVKIVQDGPLFFIRAEHHRFGGSAMASIGSTR